MVQKEMNINVASNKVVLVTKEQQNMNTLKHNV